MRVVTENLEYAQLKTFPLLGDDETEEGPGIGEFGLTTLMQNVNSFLEI